MPIFHFDERDVPKPSRPPVEEEPPMYVCIRTIAGDPEQPCRYCGGPSAPGHGMVYTRGDQKKRQLAQKG